VEIGGIPPAPHTEEEEEEEEVLQISSRSFSQRTSVVRGYLIGICLEYQTMYFYTHIAHTAVFPKYLAGIHSATLSIIIDKEH
jgi:hypothetical protein